MSFTVLFGLMIGGKPLAKSQVCFKISKRLAKNELMYSQFSEVKIQD